METLGVRSVHVGGFVEVQSSGIVPWRSCEGSKVVKVRTWRQKRVYWRFCGGSEFRVQGGT